MTLRDIVRLMIYSTVRPIAFFKKKTLLEHLSNLCVPLLNRSSKTAQDVCGGISKRVSAIILLLLFVVSRDRFGFKFEDVLVYSRSYFARKIFFVKLRDYDLIISPSLLVKHSSLQHSFTS